MPERRLRNSNKWIQGIEAAVGFLWVIFPIASKERMNIFQGMSIGESIAIGLEIIIGFIIVVGVAIIQSKMRKEEWEEENNSKNLIEQHRCAIAFLSHHVAMLFNQDLDLSCCNVLLLILQ